MGKKNSKKRGKIKWALFIGGILMVLALVALSTWLIVTRKKGNIRKSSITREQRVRMRSLLKYEKQGTKVIFTLPRGESHVVQWKDYLFYGGINDSYNIEIHSYNLKTGDTKVIYNPALRDDFDGVPGNRYLKNMQITDNTLYFFIGGYMIGGATFWIDLPPNNEPQKLSGGANNSIQSYKGRYWLVSREGDGCWGEEKYSLLDIKSKRITHIATSVFGCYEGEEFIDIDENDRMILAFHGSDQVYKHVTAVFLGTPAMKTYIISSDTMPQGITSVSYLPKTDQLLLVGKVKYLYDFDTGKITKTNNAISIPTRSFIFKNKTLEEEITSLSLPGEYAFGTKAGP